MKIAVDAGVAVRCVFSENGTVEARQLLAHWITLLAPGFMVIEEANVIWKKARRRKIEDARPYLEECARLVDAVDLTLAADPTAHATAIALQIDHPVHDCLFLACAEVERTPLVTVDRRLRDAARRQSGAEVWFVTDPDAG